MSRGSHRTHDVRQDSDYSRIESRIFRSGEQTNLLVVRSGSETTPVVPEYGFVTTLGVTGLRACLDRSKSVNTI